MSPAPLVVGIDGGGSKAHVVITTPDLTVRGEALGSTANPGVVGHAAAARTIQDTAREALTAAGVPPDQVAAVALGIAGAAAHQSEAWLQSVVADVFPEAQVVPSSDFEIALVGALGERRGMILLAGTGSLAYGVNAAGESMLVGGWGYLLDDAGSGYWLGQQALKAVARAADGRGPQTRLSDMMLGLLELSRALDLVAWMYHAGTSRTRDVAALAPLVLAAADDGDVVAQTLVDRACDELVLAAQTVIHRLALEPANIAFTGGLLTSPNRLSEAVCAALELDAIPQPRYVPAIGAALLARWALA